MDTVTNTDDPDQPARRLPWVLRRWPTWLAIAMNVVSAIGGVSVSGLTIALLILPIGYLTMAVIRRRKFTWLIVLIGVSLVAGLRMQTLIDPVTALLLAATAVLIIGLISQASRTDRFFWIQVAGMVIFAGLVLLALAVGGEAARYLIAAGWFAHGVWDLVHLRLNRVVSQIGRAHV